MRSHSIVCIVAPRGLGPCCCRQPDNHSDIPNVAATPLRVAAALAGSAGAAGHQRQLCSCSCCLTLPILLADIGRCVLVLLPKAKLRLTLQLLCCRRRQQAAGMASATSGSLLSAQRALRRL